MRGVGRASERANRLTYIWLHVELLVELLVGLSRPSKISPLDRWFSFVAQG